MPSTGPIPKRSDQRVRRNAPEVPITTVTALGNVPIPQLNIPNVHPMVLDIYESLKHSGQARYYEPSDWQFARLTMHLVNKLVKSNRPSAQMLASINTMLASLLMTEGERRRVRMEIERKPPGEEGKVLEVADLFRQRLEQPSEPAPEGFRIAPA